MRHIPIHRFQSPMTRVVIGLLFGILLMLGVGANTSLAQSTGTQAEMLEGTQDDGVLSREEILAMFEREARAAYQMNRQACEGLPDQENKKCLAAARLQFDQDLRYARRRADQGY
jgi:hypothetical protein